ncbi:hypothetical protein pdam_00018561 [Pocillopora damicornis]|uniref:Uncharacterized protein n=1 Tax=Pocillopora damicornis TaxID=46731 RepID=A0A3M6TPT0_POCDA|nr:hypothetical protein pdam_00018561 [Pocillopora damicornis]
MRGTGFIIIPIFLLACDDNESIMIHTLDFRHPRTKLNNVQSSLHTNLNKLKGLSISLKVESLKGFSTSIKEESVTERYHIGKYKRYTDDPSVPVPKSTKLDHSKRSATRSNTAISIPQSVVSTELKAVWQRTDTSGSNALMALSCSTSSKKILEHFFTKFHVYNLKHQVE